MKLEIPTLFLLDKKYLDKFFELKSVFFIVKLNYPSFLLETFFQFSNKFLRKS
jgi:hypothetical protein